ncbi:glycoside hydrolase TIM-barrel-like domain-containing protein [Amylibacter sp.]|nr:glycoside hydrolase TIM-barrel-like domain-containing protein [Amylibacter sp.]
MALKTQDKKSLTELLGSVNEAEANAFFNNLSDEALLTLPYLFEFWALPHQLEPTGDWATWVVLGGRGAGKTRAGAEWVRSKVERGDVSKPGKHKRVALIGDTLDQVREVMVFGDSGIIASSPPAHRPEWHAGRRVLIWPNGAEAWAMSASSPESLRGPQFDCVWADEFGCPAINKGANQPNVFYDPKSSESALPYDSDGSVDTLMQLQYLRATFSHWQDIQNNPQSEVYFGPMVDLSNSHVWAWDARPWPDFPNRLNVWSDGENHARGHWITGRFAEQSLAAIVSEVCEISGLLDIDVSELYGSTIGFAMKTVETGRASLQPLMLAFDFSSREVDGKLVFKNRSERIEYTALPSELAILGNDPVVGKTRAPEAETVGRVRVSYWDEMREYQTGTSEFILADDDNKATSHVELPVTLRPGQGANLASQWLISARVSRDELKIALPMAQQRIVPGDVIKLEDGATGGTYRVERIEEQGARSIEAVRVEQTVYKQKDIGSTVSTISDVRPARSVLFRFLDLPLLQSTQTSVGPHFAATASPWPGGVAAYQSASDDGYVLNTVLETPVQFGRTQTVLKNKCVGRWSEGEGVVVKLSQGALQSRSPLDVLNGANVAAIGVGSSAGCELFQFREAELLGDGAYRLHGLLRGQLGTDVEISDNWAIGSEIVFLNETPTQINLTDADRGLERYYRVGPVNKPFSDASYSTQIEAFDMIALRPLSPVHLTVRENGGDMTVSWIRRTRIDGDSWQGIDVPLGETTESYEIAVLSSGVEIRRETVASPSWVYTTANQTADGVLGEVEVNITQISERFGLGPSASTSFTV